MISIILTNRNAPLHIPVIQPSPSQLRSPGLHGKTAGSRESEETCCLPDGLRLVGVESDSVKKSVLCRSHMRGALHVFILIPHRRPLFSPPRTATSGRQAGRRQRVYSLTYAVFFHLIPPAMYQASPVPAPWSYTANKLRLGPYPCGACNVANVCLGRWETRRSIIKSGKRKW